MPDHPLAARVKLRGEALEAAAVRGGEGRRVHVICDFMHPLRELGHGLTKTSRSPRFCSVWPGQHFRSLAESSRSPESWPAESALPFCVASARFFNDFLPAHRTKFIILN